jgi:D-arabinose 1-dehydrogenase-like Zn-dependent alcohol dehydrogenase
MSASGSNAAGGCDRVRLTATGWDTDLLPESMAGPPAPRRGQIAVEVEACGVCHRDLIDRAGRFPFIQLPVTPGHEAVGRVIAVGAGVESRSVGDRVASMHRESCGECTACARGETSLCTGGAHVFGLIADGGYARWMVGPARAFYPMTGDVEPALAAVMHCTFGTAWRGLVTAGGLQAGERVVITGANGGVGAAAIQIAARLGATEVVAVVRDPAHEAWLLELGASRVVVDTEGRFHKKGVHGMDLALECVGSPTFNASLRALQVGGRLAVVGNVSEARVELNVGQLIVKGLRIIGPGGATPADMAALLAHHATRPWTLPITSLPLAEADAAQRRLRDGGIRGRLVLRPDEPHRSRDATAGGAT